MGAPLEKVQCGRCGLLRQNPLPETLKSALYRDNYVLYHQRPGTAASEASRYAAMAVWIFSELAPFKPTSVLDVGCGGGVLLDALRRLQPALQCAGIDPSIENSAVARSRGFSVTTGFIPAVRPPRDQYDLVLASNVISHILDPIDFLQAMADVTAPNGRVLIYSHDGGLPGADHLWADVEYSYCREHLGTLGARVGLELSDSRGIAPPPHQTDKHVLVFRRNAAPAAGPPLSDATRDELLEGRRRYFGAWRSLAARLAQYAQGTTGPFFNFGASFWSMLLAAYCPAYWARVEACVVDQGSGMFLEKPLLLADDLPKSPQPLIVLGTNPLTQARLRQRLGSHAEVITWDDLITR